MVFQNQGYYFGVVICWTLYNIGVSLFVETTTRITGAFEALCTWKLHLVFHFGVVVGAPAHVLSLEYSSDASVILKQPSSTHDNED